MDRGRAGVYSLITSAKKAGMSNVKKLANVLILIVREDIKNQELRVAESLKEIDTKKRLLEELLIAEDNLQDPIYLHTDKFGEA